MRFEKLIQLNIYTNFVCHDVLKNNCFKNGKLNKIIVTLRHLIIYFVQYNKNRFRLMSFQG